jgi:hypothetical protein
MSGCRFIPADDRVCSQSSAYMICIKQRGTGTVFCANIYLFSSQFSFYQRYTFIQLLSRRRKLGPLDQVRTQNFSLEGGGVLTLRLYISYV